MNENLRAWLQNGGNSLTFTGDKNSQNRIRRFERRADEGPSLGT